MTSDPLKPVCITTCQTTVEADVLKFALEEAGIETTIEGAELNSAFALPLSGHSISGVHVVVRSNQVEEAMEVVERTRRSWDGPPKDPWFCGACLEEIEGNFEICWSCGKSRDEIESEFPETALHVETTDVSDIDTNSLGRETDNPYESPRAMGNAAFPEAAQQGIGDVDDVKDIERKMRIALLFSLACFFVPVFPVFVVLNQLVAVTKARSAFTPKAKTLLWSSIVLLVLAHVIWFFLIGTPSFR